MHSHFENRKSTRKRVEHAGSWDVKDAEKTFLLTHVSAANCLARNLYACEFYVLENHIQGTQNANAPKMQVIHNAQMQWAVCWGLRDVRYKMYTVLGGVRGC